VLIGKGKDVLELRRKKKQSRFLGQG
jgi:hypothetical protein